MSSLIKLQTISFTYNNLTREIFSHVTHNFHQGWTSVCGENGSGKTTLLKLVTAELKPTLGSVETKGKIVTVPQSTEHAPKNLDELRFDFSKQTVQAKASLQIEEDWYDRWDTLSIGERKRLQLAAALSLTPDILLVDEPTNHVDAPTRQVVLTALRNFSGTGILVSHDRLLLNKLCTNTVFLEAGQLEVYKAAYDQAKVEQVAKLKLLAHTKEGLKKEHSRTQKSVQQQVEKIAKNKAKLSKKSISPKDHDAKAKIYLAKVSGADFKDSRKKQTLTQKSERISDKLQSLKTKKTYNLGVFFEESPRVRQIYFPKRKLSFPYLSIVQPSVKINAGDKLALVGPNGAGKSTLLKSWVSEIKQDFVYLPQEFTKQETKTLAASLQALDKEVRGKVMTLVSCLGSSPKSLAEGSAPSPGMWQKILIAKAIVTAVFVLVLDEPTNHLDLAALEVLEEALKQFKGIVICVSHDEQFVRNVCNTCLELKKNDLETTVSEKNITSR